MVLLVNYHIIQHKIKDFILWIHVKDLGKIIINIIHQISMNNKM